MRFSSLFAIILSAFLLTACGGSLDGSETNAETAGTTTDTSGSTASQTVDMSLRLLICPIDWDNDAAKCVETTKISSTAPGKVEVTLLKNGVALPNEIITATSTAGTLSETSGLTSPTGRVIFDLLPGNSTGAGRLTMATDALNIETSRILNFAIDAASVATPASIGLSLRLLNCPENWANDLANCTDTVEISALNPGKVAVTLLENGLPFENQIIKAESSVGTISVGTDLTRVDGTAVFDLLAGDAVGAGTISVSTNISGIDASETSTFKIGATNVEMVISDNLAGSTIAQNATALVTVELKTDAGAFYTSPVEVKFSSPCATVGNAKLDDSVFTVNGIASATYQPTNCSGNDLITATSSVNNLSQNLTIIVDSAPAHTIHYISASPKWIAIEGTGGVGRSEASTLTFKVVDQNDNASTNQDVEFILDIGPSGTTISPITAKTNSSGEVITVVSAGKVSGVVRVRVKIKDSLPLITSVSDELTVSTGLPDQNSFSISLEDHAPESWNTDGIIVKSTVRLADHFNNAVPNGTAVYFTTEGGSIKDAATGTIGSCMTTGSECTLEWESQNPRPQGNQLEAHVLANPAGCASSLVQSFAPCINSGGMGQPYAGRVTITAFAIGEESFVDKNANGWFDAGDTFKIEGNITGSSYDVPEVFYDDDENGSYDTSTVSGAEEKFHDFNPVDGSYSAGNSIFNGMLCSEIDDSDGLCERKLINVRGSQSLIMASSFQNFRVQNNGVDVNSVDFSVLLDASTPPIDIGVSSATLKVYIADLNNNRPPTGSKITVTTDNGELSGQVAWELSDGAYYGPFILSLTIGREKADNNKSTGLALITITSPAGAVSTYQIMVND
jgi:hypothetical protein